MQSSSPQIQVNELLSISIQLVFEAMKVIHEVHSTNSLQESWKGKNDPLTLADIKSQTLILKGLSHFFPQIKVVAEEDEVFPGKLDVDFSKLQRNFLSEELFPSKLAFSAEELTAFVDPLDGTFCFVCGDLQFVTVLLGFALNKRPEIGIMGRIWNKDSQGKLFFDPVIYFGCAQTQRVFYYRDFLEGKPLQNAPVEVPKPVKRDLSKEFVVVYSQNRMNEVLEKNIQVLKPTRAYKAGATGFKCLSIVLGLADCYFYEVELMGTKRWDTCVGEALINCFGGILTGKDGKLYQYETEGDQRNLKGVVALLDREKHKEVIEITKNMPYDESKLKF